MKKNLLKLFVILSVTGNVAALLFYSNSNDLLYSQTSEREQRIKSRKRGRGSLGSEAMQLDAQRSRDKAEIMRLRSEIKALNRRLTGQNEGDELSSQDSPTLSRAEKKYAGLSPEAAKAGVKKVILGIALKDKDGDDISVSSEDIRAQFIHDVLPFMSQKDAVLDSFLDVLKDREQKDRHELTLSLLFRARDLIGADRNFDLKIVDLLSNEGIDAGVRGELAGFIDTEKYKKDVELAEKLLDLVNDGNESVRVSILYHLEYFDLDSVTAAVERIAFNTSEDPHIRQAALRSLSGSKDYTRDMMALMTHSNNALRAAAIQKLSSQRAVPGLLERIHNLAKSEQDRGVLWSMINFISDGGNLTSIPILRDIENRPNLPSDLRDYAKSHRLAYEREAAELEKAKK